MKAYNSGELSQDEHTLNVVRLQGGALAIIGNRAELKDLATARNRLGSLSDEEAKTGVNVQHVADYLSNAEPGSLELIVLCDLELCGHRLLPSCAGDFFENPLGGGG